MFLYFIDHPILSSWLKKTVIISSISQRDSTHSFPILYCYFCMIVYFHAIFVHILNANFFFFIIIEILDFNVQLIDHVTNVIPTDVFKHSLSNIAGQILKRRYFYFFFIFFFFDSNNFFPRQIKITK